MTSDSSSITPAFARILALLFFSVFINYIDRSNLSIAAPLIKDELGISASQLGFLLSAFFWTYSGCQLLSGWLVDHYDVKWIFAAGFFLWSSATAVTGMVHSLGWCGSFLAWESRWRIPDIRRSWRCIVRKGGVALPTRLFRAGWHWVRASVCYSAELWSLITAGARSSLCWDRCACWLVPWLRWMPATKVVGPDQHAGPGMREIVPQGSAWGTCIGLFCGNYFLYSMVTWLPFYLVRERHYSMLAMARTGGAFFFVGALSATLCGWSSDRWIHVGATPTLVRKTFMVAGFLGCGASLLASVVARNGWAIAFLMLAGVFFGFSASNVLAITQRLAGPEAAGRWSGLQLFVGNTSGVVAPAVTGFLLDRTGHFFWPFLIVSLVLWAGTLSWIFLVGAVEPVDWERCGSISPHTEAASAN